MTGTYDQLPADLPVPVDDGSADHLPGLALPSISLPATSGGEVDLSTLGASRTVVYIYPMTGRPGVALPAGWDEIPGARGCTPESIGFRDHHEDWNDLGVGVFGLSSQSSAYQTELAQRLELPFPVLSDEAFALAQALRLPTFQSAGQRLYTRLTLVIAAGMIEHVFYPVFPTDTHAAVVAGWLRDNPPVTIPSSTGERS
jgi:peroxiredoxin